MFKRRPKLKQLPEEFFEDYRAEFDACEGEEGASFRRAQEFDALWLRALVAEEELGADLSWLKEYRFGRGGLSVPEAVAAAKQWLIENDAADFVRTTDMARDIVNGVSPADAAASYLHKRGKAMLQTMPVHVHAEICDRFDAEHGGGASERQPEELKLFVIGTLLGTAELKGMKFDFGKFCFPDGTPLIDVLGKIMDARVLLGLPSDPYAAITPEMESALAELAARPMAAG